MVPSNPIIAPSYIPHIGELLPASFPVPQNPLIAAISSPPGYGLPNQPTLGCGCSTGCGSGMCGDRGMSGLSGDCGCIGGMCGCGMGGLGLFEDPMSMLLLAGGAVLLFMLMTPGGKQYHVERERLAQTYQRGVRRLKGESRGYKRVARRASAALVRGAQAAQGAVA